MMSAQGNSWRHQLIYLLRKLFITELYSTVALRLLSHKYEGVTRKTSRWVSVYKRYMSQHKEKYVPSTRKNYAIEK